MNIELEAIASCSWCDLKAENEGGQLELEQIITFSEITQSDATFVGGKAANLVNLRHAGFQVPNGFCITTSAYRTWINASKEVIDLLEEIDRLKDDLPGLIKVGKQIRQMLENLPIPEAVSADIIAVWKAIGPTDHYAIRSSSTAEDLPEASFAGQQDSYLNVTGLEELLYYIRKCWISLYSDRAILYRTQHHFSHGQLALSVIVQKMVFPDAAGVMFTADPLSGNRRLLSINSCYGLGEAIVAGLVVPDLYVVQDKQIVCRQAGNREFGIFPKPEGGTERRNIPVGQKIGQILTDDQILELAEIGRQIEQCCGNPQDIEWCLAGDNFYVVQSRPITTLYPPPVKISGWHVFFSLGHQQMMLDAIRPMGISILRTYLPYAREISTGESQKFVPAGCRLYLDATDLLSIKLVRRFLPSIVSNIDAQMSRTLEEVLERAELKTARPNLRLLGKLIGQTSSLLRQVVSDLLFRDPAKALADSERIINSSLVEANQCILDQKDDPVGALQACVGNLAMSWVWQLVHYQVAGIICHKLLKLVLRSWLDDDTEMPELGKSLSGNVTSEMGLQLGDLADAFRAYPELTAYLSCAKDRTFLDGLSCLKGGEEVRVKFEQFLESFGDRCAGELDITNARWREVPTVLVPAILSHLRNCGPGEHRTRFQDGKQEAKEATDRLLELLAGNGLLVKRRVVERLVKMYRYLMAVREHPKAMVIQHFALYRRVLFQEAGKLRKQGYITELDDVFYLTLPELRNLTLTGQVEGVSGSLNEYIAVRRQEFAEAQRLIPPRVITNEGEIIKHRGTINETSAGVLLGTPVASGIVEGRANVVLKPEEADISEGDILIAPYTDPGWTPLFLSIKGLVVEIGGLMTHGAVIAREYGIPTVVGIENATTRIKSGQVIRINGDLGSVEILSRAEIENFGLEPPNDVDVGPRRLNSVDDDLSA